MSKRDELTVELQNVEIRSIEGRRPVIAGSAIVFNSWSQVMVNERGRQFRERIAPTAFDRALVENPDIRALWNHNSDMPLGRTRNGTLILRKDGVGLHIELEPPANSWGADALESIRRGDVSGMSFAFQAKRDGGDTWAKGADGIAERTLIDADLYEVSPVVFPAYPATSVGVRSVDVPDFVDDSQEAATIEEPTGDEGRAAGVVTTLRQSIEILRRR